MYITRSMEERWAALSEQFPALLLTGPRQVGKTTTLEHLCEPDRAYVTLDDPNARTLARGDPELFLQRYSPPLLIDEIQYAPELLPIIKMRIDRDRQPGAFWLTGSQQFQLMQGITESLAGRVGIANLLGFSMHEARGEGALVRPFLPEAMASAPPRAEGDGAHRRDSLPAAPPPDLKSVYRRIWQGAFPALVAGEVSDRDVFYRSYVETYLHRDVRALAQVGDLDAFHTFLRACAARTGQLLNYSDLARDCGVSVNTARHWLSILEASFQVILLRPFHSNLSKRLYKTPKLYFVDTGLCAYLTEWSTPETLEAGAMSGAIFETFAFIEILKSWWHRVEVPTLHFYRDKDGREVDLIISRDGKLHPVEFKKSARVQSDWVQGFGCLERFGEVAEGAVVCMCGDTMPIDRRNLAVPVTHV